jgi:hypothetical protein
MCDLPCFFTVIFRTLFLATADFRNDGNYTRGHGNGWRQPAKLGRREAAALRRRAVPTEGRPRGAVTSRGENGVSAADGEGGVAAGHPHGLAKLKVETSRPDVASIARRERLKVTMAKVARGHGGEVVLVAERENGVEAGVEQGVAMLAAVARAERSDGRTSPESGGARARGAGAICGTGELGGIGEKREGSPWMLFIDRGSDGEAGEWRIGAATAGGVGGIMGEVELDPGPIFGGNVGKV